jgi:hypothetical protein
VAVRERADRPRRRNSVLGICIRRNREFSRADHYVELAAQIETSNAGRRVAQSGFQEKAIKLLALDAGASGSLGHAVSKLTYPDAAAEIMI